MTVRMRVMTVRMCVRMRMCEYLPDFFPVTSKVSSDIRLDAMAVFRCKMAVILMHTV